MTLPCICPEPNQYCNRAGTPMTDKLWKLCSGTNCSEHLSAAYRTAWDSKGTWESDKLTLRDRLIRFVQAVIRLLESRSDLLSRENVSARLEICGKCDKLAAGKCALCGCLVVLKAHFPTESCPLSKWPGILPAKRTVSAGGCGCGGS